MAQLNDLLVRGDSNLLGVLNVFGDVTAPNFLGNASSATKLATARKISVNLGTNTIATFDGSGDITTGVTGTLRVVDGGTGIGSNPSMLINLASTSADTVFKASPRPGVTGTLGAANGGTGKTTLQDACNAFINALSEGTSNPQDADYYVAQYAGGGTTTKTYHRRSHLALYNYIKGKLDNVYIQKGTGNSDFVNVTGDTMTGTLIINKTADASGTANNKPALIVGGTDTTSHIEIDSNEIMAKADGTTVGPLYLNNDGGLVNVGSGGLAVKGTLDVSGISHFKARVVIKGDGSSYNECLRLLPASNGWSNIFFSANDTESGEHDGGWLIGRRGAAGGTTGAIGDFTIEEQSSSGVNLTIHKNSDGATLTGILRLRGTTGVQLQDNTASVSWSTATGTPYIKPNSIGGYGALMISGAKGSYHGILLGPDTKHMVLMSSNPHQGLYNQDRGCWITYYDYTNQRVGIGTSTTVANYLVTTGGNTYINGSALVNGNLTINPNGSIYISQTAGTGAGLALYGTDPGAYGIFFAKTSNFGKYGDVQSDWATYFSMSDTAQRGWVFRKGGTNTASLSTGGNLTLNGYAKIGNKVRLEYTVATESLEFIFD